MGEITPSGRWQHQIKPAALARAYGQNKQKHCCLAGIGGKRWPFLREKKGCQEGQEGFAVTSTSETVLGRTPTCPMDIWPWLFNKHGAEFQTSSVYFGGNQSTGICSGLSMKQFLSSSWWKPRRQVLAASRWTASPGGCEISVSFL